MSRTNISRRKFAAATSFGLVTACTQRSFATQDAPAQKVDKNGPREAIFERDYDAPSFKPGWKKAQVNRTMAQDFVIYAHSDLPMVKKLLTREPGLLNATLDWGGGDWETAMGGASHMGRRDIVEYLLEQGGRPDIFCFTMLGLLEPVQSMLELQPSLIDAKGPHGFSLHFHAQVGQKDSKDVLDYLQSVKEIELRPVPFLNKKKSSKTG
ncbi:MAG: hypothetical protein OSA89_07415 [Mariniblastus sp.]|nr:hypothetical protein [Mariniblastus sp.]